MRESPRRLLRLKRDPLDRRRPERTAASFVASALVHALVAAFLFSLATSSSQAPESLSGAVVITVTSQPVPARAPVLAASQPRKHSAPARPYVHHELAKFAPTAPPNPTPPPTAAPIEVSPAPLPVQVPTAAPVTVSARVALRSPKPMPRFTPKPLPSLTPKPLPALTPQPEPSVIAVTAAPLAPGTPVPAATAQVPSQVKIAGPRGVAQAAKTAAARPVQALAATPPPARVRAPARRGRPSSLNERLKNLIPTAEPSFVPATPKVYSGIGGIRPTPQPEPTPPPGVIAATKFLYVENVGSQRWKQSWLGTAPEERYVKMYVTSVKRIGFIRWCTGWVLRAPIAGSAKWIVEPNESFICSGRLEPFSPPSPLPTSAPAVPAPAS